MDENEATTVEEVANIISTLAELKYLSSVDIHLRKSYSVTQTSNVTLPVIAPNKLLQRGKLRIGWINCRVRLRTIKYYRCHQSGHQTKDYKSEVDRSKQCFRCGNERRKAGHCGINNKRMNL